MDKIIRCSKKEIGMSLDEYKNIVNKLEGMVL